MKRHIHWPHPKDILFLIVVVAGLLVLENFLPFMLHNINQAILRLFN